MNIAHFITFSRIFIVPLFPLFYLGYRSFGIDPIYIPYILLTVLASCELTDLLDGIFARRKNQVTDLGKLIDPMADTITRLTVLFSFTQGWVAVPIGIIFVFLYRELIISTLRTICALKGFALAARTSGKAKAILLAIINFFIVILMIPYTLGFLSLGAFQLIAVISVSIGAVFSVLTAFDYFKANSSYIRKILKSE